MKLVRENSKPISGDTGLHEIKALAESNQFRKVDESLRGTYEKVSILNDYVDKLLSFVDFKKFNRPLRLVVNSGNGAAGHVIDAIEKRFKAANIDIEFVKVHHTPDGNFPNGIPNPLLRNVARIRPMPYYLQRLIWELHLMVISIDVFFLIIKENL